MKIRGDPVQVEITRQSDRKLTVATRDVELTVDREAAEGESSDGFRATELLMGALGACMLGTAQTFARNQEMPLEDLAVTVEGVSAERPSRLETFRVTLTVTGDLTDRQLESLARVAARCKVHNTITHQPDVELTVARAGAASERRAS